MKEIFKDIKHFEGIYQISNLGNLKSLHYRKERILKVCPNNDGYLRIRLSNKNSAYDFLINRLVAIYFIPNPLNLLEVNHKDGNKLNNCATNLEWVTHSENQKHAYKSGLYNRESIYNRNRKLTDKQVLAIRSLRGEGLKLKEIANMFNIGLGNVYNITSRKSWKHL